MNTRYSKWGTNILLVPHPRGQLRGIKLILNVCELDTNGSYILPYDIYNNRSG
jgi:hypothetical protein